MITVSYETAKRLKEAGWKKECEFVYYGIGSLEVVYFGNSELHRKDMPFPIYEAPTLQEILEELPHRVNLYIAKDHYCIATTIKEYPIIKNYSAVEAAVELWIILQKDKK